MAQQNYNGLSGIDLANCKSQNCDKPQPDTNSCSVELYGEEYCNCFDGYTKYSGVARKNCKSKCNKLTTTN